MYNLAPRFPKPKTGGTPAPNTYIICEDRDTRANYTPFLSGTERKFTMGRTVYSDSLYYPDLEFPPRIKGGASLQNKGSRFKYKKDDIPGPAEYDPEIPKEGCKYKPPPRHGKGRLYVCRVPYTIATSAPSIPTHLDENGYYIDQDGNIVKVLPYKHDTTIGPAYYHIPRGDFCFTTRRYHHGCRWSVSKSKRFNQKISDTPAPNVYDVNCKLCRGNQSDESYRELARRFSFLPRYTEAVMLQKQREDLPGPGQYNVNVSSFQCPKSLSINPRPFVVGAKRFTSTQSDTPGPGDYGVVNYPKKEVLLRKAPFGVQSSRLPKQKHQNLPGPATYNIKGPIEDKLNSKINKYSVVDVPFCQTAERKMGSVPRDSYFTPGPGEYDVVPEEIEKQPVHASCFKSTTIRGGCPRMLEDADPGSYNVCEAFNKNRNRTSHNTGKVPFLSSQSRTSGRRVQTPGPADYVSQGRIGEKGLSFSTIPRFKYDTSDIPPPGSYTVHPSKASSIYKATATHNLRLKESVIQTKLRLPPTATWQKWVSEMEKKKKLRWFSKPTPEYRHCVAAV